MKTNLLFLSLMLAVSAGCHRAIRLPPVAGVPLEAEFERGVNARTRLLEYELPAVRVSDDTAKGITVTGLPVAMGNVDLRQQRSFELTRAGALIGRANCSAAQKGSYVAWGSLGRDDSRHEYLCRSEGFELAVRQSAEDQWSGTVRRGPVTLELVSTDDMASGPPQSLCGFHVYRGQKWVASFEYFWGGKAYLSQRLTPLERETVIMAMVAVVSTDGWLMKDPRDNQPTSIFTH